MSPRNLYTLRYGIMSPRNELINLMKLHGQRKQRVENPSTYNSTVLNSAHFKCCRLFSFDVRGEKSVTSSALSRKFNA